MPCWYREKPISCVFAERVSVAFVDCCVIANTSVSTVAFLDFNYTWVPLFTCLNVGILSSEKIQICLWIYIYICQIVAVLCLILKIRFLSSSVYYYNPTRTCNSSFVTFVLKWQKQKQISIILRSHNSVY
jgi:hypothetical protein